MNERGEACKWCEVCGMKEAICSLRHAPAQLAQYERGDLTPMKGMEVRHERGDAQCAMRM